VAASDGFNYPGTLFASEVVMRLRRYKGNYSRHDEGDKPEQKRMVSIEIINSVPRPGHGKFCLDALINEALHTLELTVYVRARDAVWEAFTSQPLIDICHTVIGTASYGLEQAAHFSERFLRVLPLLGAQSKSFLNASLDDVF
jgi:hypothetical protein